MRNFLQEKYNFLELKKVKGPVPFFLSTKKKKTKKKKTVLMKKTVLIPTQILVKF